jgi:eukaryotic-like serine/threonine-protein kinase
VNEGDLLFGKYRVERVVGSGGMGIVVAARHEQLDQLVAIKFITEDALAHADAALRFLHEARAAAKLKSEHVTRVLDVGMLDSGAPYMIMEYLEGSDLEKVVAQFGPMPVPYALHLFRQACAALAEAHAAGIVHRDLKPQNLFLTHTPNGSPRLKVLDFGISKTPETVGSRARHARTGATTVLGSPVYMAPEQMLSSRDVDARADVWSLGVVLFELLTKRCPFEADTYAALCLKIATGEPIRVADLREDVPAEVSAIIERCLEKDATRRFANAGEVGEAIDTLPPDLLPATDAEGRPGWSTVSTAPALLRRSEITPAGWWASQGRGKTRSRALATVAVLLAGTLLALGVVVSRRRGDAQSTSVVPAAPPVAGSSVPEAPSAQGDLLQPSEIAADSPSRSVLTGPSEAPSPRSPGWSAPRARPTATGWVAPPRMVDSDGMPVQGAPSPRWNAAGSPARAATHTPPVAAHTTTAVPADYGIPSRR